VAGELIFEKMGPVYTIEINRPDKHNSLSISLLVQLQNLVEAVQKDPEARVLVITGVGDKAFSSGFEISEIQGARAIKPGIEHDYIENALAAIRNCCLPVIAMVNGYAVGAGCDLVLNCDLRIASATARFGMGPAKMGAMYSEQGLWRFINTIGVAHTKDLFFTARIIDAYTAKEMGLINQVVPASELTQVTYTIAREIAHNAPLSIGAMKKIISWLMEREIPSDLQKQINELKTLVFCSRDCQEGQKAFLEKRTPVFAGE
jgi:enoyl-CoA hydratase/carnithine racemase